MNDLGNWARDPKLSHIAGYEFKKIVLIFFILAISTLAYAQGDHGFLNTPNENERANACYEGGTMEGKCITNWDWEAGWYLIRFEYGLISREDFPPQYSIVLPPLPEQSNNNPRKNCQIVDDFYGIYLDFGSGYFVESASPAYSDSRCRYNGWGYIANDYVYSPSGAAFAISVCETLALQSRALPTSNPNVYMCQP